MKVEKQNLAEFHSLPEGSGGGGGGGDDDSSGVKNP